MEGAERPSIIDLLGAWAKKSRTKLDALLLITGFLTAFTSAFLSAGLSTLFQRERQETKTEARLEEQLPAVFQTLQENSRQATQLLARLQSEVANRNKAMQEIDTKLQELRQQRTLLELTPEQRQAIEGLVRRPVSLRDIFTSLDFWVGRFALSVTLSTVFFLLGQRRGRRRTSDSP
jgi:DNA repair exonuclease SbcCD ATPase subunit